MEVTTISQSTVQMSSILFVAANALLVIVNLMNIFHTKKTLKKASNVYNHAEEYLSKSQTYLSEAHALRAKAVSILEDAEGIREKSKTILSEAILLNQAN